MSWRSCRLVFVRISTETQDILAKVFHSFLQSLKANTWIVSRLGHNRFLTNSLQFSIRQSSYHSKLYSLDTDIINNPLERKVHSNINENTTKAL
jgi:hypothetical protein